MKIIIDNNILQIINSNDQTSSKVKKNLTYIDKSKQFQLNKMLKNPYYKNQSLIDQLQNQVQGKLYSEDLNTNTITISSSLYDLFLDDFSSAEIIDNRHTNGKTIALPWVNKPYDLRPYQQEAVDVAVSKYRGLINLATGLGKTLISLYIVKSIKKKTLIVCPSQSVASQFYDIFKKSFGANRIGFFGNGKKKINDITIGIAASICKPQNIELFKKEGIGLLIMDECHHCPASTFADITTQLAHIGHIYGLTATNYRSDGKDIMIFAGCGPVIIAKDVKWGVANNFLATPFFLVKKISTNGRDLKRDKLAAYKEHVINNSIMKNTIESDARSMMAAGKAVLVLVSEVAHGEELSKNLGIPFATGQDKKSQEYVDLLNQGKISGLIGTSGKIGEGSDTQNVDVLILANFIASKGPVIQAVGRGLRKTPTKDKCLIIDYIPVDSSILSRHALGRLKFYKDITNNIKVLEVNN